MNKTIKLVIFFTCYCVSSTAFATPTTIWSIGSDDTNQRGRNNANEFDDQPNSHQTQYRAALKFGQTEDNPGDPPLKFPGYLDDDESFIEVCTRLNLRCKNHSRDYSSAEEININVNAGNNYCSNVELTYHRHGTETDQVAYTLGNNPNDKVVITTVGGFEAKHYAGIIPLPDIPGKEFTISIRYQGGGLDNGHFIDFIKLTGDCTVMP